MEKFEIKKKILIVGGSSLLGINWAVKVNSSYNIYLAVNKKKIKVKNTKIIKINFDNLIETEKTITKINPTYIINLAAITDVDYCEFNKKKAYIVNTEIPVILSNITNKLNCKLLQISTDQLFNKQDKFINEKVKVTPVNYYAKTKYLAEKKIIQICKNYLIIRTNFFGYGTKYKKSYSEFILDELEKKDKIILSNNIFFNPIYICNLIKICDFLLNKNIVGLFNLSADDNISKYQFGIKLCNELKLKDNYNNKILATKHKTTKVLRPLQMSLSNKKIKKIYKRKIGTLEENIIMMIDDKAHEEKLKAYVK